MRPFGFILAMACMNVTASAASEFIVFKQFHPGAGVYVFIAMTEDGRVWQSPEQQSTACNGSQYTYCGQVPTTDQVADVFLYNRFPSGLHVITVGGELWSAPRCDDPGGWTYRCTVNAATSFVGLDATADYDEMYALTADGQIWAGGPIGCDWTPCGTIGGTTAAAESGDTGLRDISIRPNPFNPTATIDYVVPHKGNASLEVYDIAGRLVRTLVRGKVEAGNQSVNWDGRDSSGQVLPSGTYFYSLTLDGQVLDKGKAVILK